MADSALERYLKDKQLQDTQPGKNKNIEEIKESFQDTLTGLTEPKPPVKFFRSLFPKKTNRFFIIDTRCFCLLYPYHF